MKQSFVKMMNMIAEMENCILKGMVLDERGKWVTIADRKAVEDDTVAHLSDGQVLFEGRWINFRELKASRSRRIEKPPFFDIRTIFRKTTKTGSVPSSTAVQPSTQVLTPPDTRIIVQMPLPEKPEPPPSPEKQKQAHAKEAAPETAIIIHEPPPLPEKQKQATAAPETVIIIHEPPPLPEKQKQATAAPETTFIKKTAAPVQKAAQETAFIKKTAAPVQKAAQETAIIEKEPPQDKDTGHEEYAPETKIIVFKPPDHGAASPPDTQIITKDRDTKILQVSKTVPQENAPPPKNRMVLIVGTVVVIAAIAAILFVIVQMVR